MRNELNAAVTWLLERQHADGWWTGELETNVTMTAEHILLLRFLGRERRADPGWRARAHLAGAARGWFLGAVRARPGGCEHDDRSVRRAEIARRRRDERADAARARRDPTLRRPGPGARLHADMDGAVRSVSVVGHPDDAARARLPTASGSPQSLRFRVLGARDDRAADDRHLAAPRPIARRRSEAS